MDLTRMLHARIQQMTDRQKQTLLDMMDAFNIQAAPEPGEEPRDACPTAGPTLSCYALNTYMRRKSATFSQNATISYHNAFKRIFKYLGHMHLDKIRHTHINDFFLALQTTETAQRIYRNGKLVDTGKPLAHASVIKYYTVLHNMFADAYKVDEIIPVNPMDKVLRPCARKDDQVPEIDAYTAKEARYILKCLAREPLTCQIIVKLLLDTGCRRGEMAGLRWQDVDFESNTVKICNNLQYCAELGVYATTPKGHKNRVVSVSPELMEQLQRLKETQRKQSAGGYCFVHPNGKVIAPQYATKYLYEFGKKYGIKNLHPHALRHTAASIAITSGADVASVSAKLGHSDNSTTLDMYTHTNLEAMQRADEIYRNALYAEDE